MKKDKIFSISNEEEFQNLALETFHFQAENIPVYKDYISYLNINPAEIKDIKSIPFLPVEFFKSHKIIQENKTPELIFESSSTTGLNTSKHLVADSEMYLNSLLKGFGSFYGDPSEFCILALLPSYLERSGSSLVYMAEKLISLSEHKSSGFYLHNYEELMQILRKLRRAGQKTLLIGVSFALVELAELFEEDLDGIIVMETGGMKGRRKEMVREDLHDFLKKRFNLKMIHSEYGMTELLSQAYSKGEGIFYTPPWMKVYIRDSYDPFSFLTENQSGNIRIIDLANLYSCSFIDTSDLGKIYSDGGFTVLGRIDNSDIRGCNLMIE